MAEPQSQRADNVIDLDVYRAVRTIQRRRAAARRPIAWVPMPQACTWAPWLVATPVARAPVAVVGRRSSA